MPPISIANSMEIPQCREITDQTLHFYPADSTSDENKPDQRLFFYNLFTEFTFHFSTKAWPQSDW